MASKCKFRDSTCHQCGKRGHLKAVCRSKTKKPSGGKKQPPSPRKVCQIGDEYQEEEENSLYTIKAVSASHPLMIQVEIDGQCVQMELDTGAAYSIMSEITYQELWPDGELETYDVKLKCYSGTNITVKGSREVLVSYNDQVAKLTLIVVNGAGSSLFGRNWLQVITLDWNSINTVANGEVQTILEKHHKVFSGGLGTLKGFKVKISIDPKARPKF